MPNFLLAKVGKTWEKVPMQNTLANTQAGRVEVSGLSPKDAFYVKECQKIRPNSEDVEQEFKRFRDYNFSEQKNTRVIHWLRHIRRMLKQPTEQKKSVLEKYFSQNEGKLISVEMECVFDDKDTMPKQKDLGQFLVTMCDDGSIRTESDTEGSAEVKVTISQHNPMRLKKVTDKLSHSGGGINSSCGMHIHLDQRGVSYLTASKRAKRLIKCLPALTKLVAPSRLSNNYCMENAPICGDGTQYRHSSNRYRMINFLPAYEEHKTIEVRLHGGTLDFWKILGWINLCQFLMDCTEIDRIAIENYEKGGTRYMQVSIEDILRIEKMPETLRSYVWKRFRQFHTHPAFVLREKLSEEGKFHLTDGMAIS